MDDVLFARSQMAMSLAFHIVFAAVGVAMPLLMVLAEVRWLRTRERDYLRLTRAWAKGTAVLFAVGAVSGTVLSFELGLLFPVFMRQAGAVIGMPFSLEGIAFFTEAVFLGVYLYGWRRVSPRLHVAAGIAVAASGLASSVFVTLANAWMNAPRGFRVERGAFVDIDPLAAMTTPFALHEVLHMAAAAYMATAFGVAGVHACMHLRAPSAFHRRAIALALLVAAPAALVQPALGHLAGHAVARDQPLKLAAMERQYRTQARAPLHLGGLADDDARTIRGALEIPAGLSLLAAGDPAATVRGLEAFPRADWPHPVVRPAFQAMVGIGMALAALSLLALVHRAARRRFPDGRWFLVTLVVAAPAGFVALEAGWVVTEVGRQPWIIYGVLRTAQAVTPIHGLAIPFTLFTALYAGLAIAVVAILARQIAAAGSAHEERA